MVKSRNRSVIGRHSGNIIDLYMSRDQCIARLWPVDQIYEPTPQFLATHEAVRVERRIEKFLSDNDRIALRLRAVRSRYNWWEILGRIYLSLAFTTPLIPCGFRLLSISYVTTNWRVTFETERRVYETIHIITPDMMFANGHNWIYETHREAGLENTLRGKEVLHPWRSYNYYSHQSRPVRVNFQFSRQIHPIGCYFWVDLFHDSSKKIFAGQTGIYRLTTDRPWWLHAPLTPG